MRSWVPIEMPRCAGALVAAVLVAGGSQAEGQDTVYVDDSHQCEGCVRFAPAQAVGDEDDPLPFSQPRLSVAGDGTIVMIDPTALEGVAIFDAAGNYSGSLGRVGEGPGEFQPPVRVAYVDRGDSLIVGDAGGRRLNVFGPEGEFHRRLRIPGAPVRHGGFRRLRNGDFLVNHRYRFAGAQDHRSPLLTLPLHRYDSEGERVCEFGASEPADGLVSQVRAELEPELQERIALVTNREALAVDEQDRVWTARPRRYEIEVWEPCAAAPDLVLKREARWFEGEVSDGVYVALDGREKPPNLVDLHVDEEGRLWVLARVPVADSEVVEWTARIEVIDPEQGMVLASGDYDGGYLAFTPQGVPYIWVTDDVGRAMPKVLSLELVDAPRR